MIIKTSEGAFAKLGKKLDNENKFFTVWKGVYQRFNRLRLMSNLEPLLEQVELLEAQVSRLHTEIEDKEVGRHLSGAHTSLGEATEIIKSLEKKEPKDNWKLKKRSAEKKLVEFRRNIEHAANKMPRGEEH